MAERQPSTTLIIEPVDEQYNVGNVVRSLRKAYLDPKPNQLTPANMVALLESLQELTDQISGSNPLNPLRYLDCEDLPTDDLQRLCRDAQRWRNRLGDYLARARAAAEVDPDDRMAIVHTVTMPLFWGRFGGPTGSEYPLPGTGRVSRGVMGGFPEVFDPRPQRPPDLRMPFTLANQVGVYQSHNIKILGQLIKDIVGPPGVPKLPPEPPNYLKWLLVGVGAVAALYVIRKVS